MRVLIIEDSAAWQLRYRTDLPSTVEIVEARKFEVANTIIDQLIAGTTTFDAIVFDGCLYGNDFDTPPLIKKVKAFGFAGPMIAGSSNPRLNIMLMAVGCTHDAGVKERVVGLLYDTLNLE